MKKIIYASLLGFILAGCSFNDPTIPEEKTLKNEEIIIKEPDFNNGESFQENSITNEDLIKTNQIEENLNQQLSNLEESEDNPELKDIGITKLEDIKIRNNKLSLSELFYTLNFNYNQYSLDEEGKRKLKKLITFLKQNEDSLENKKIIIEGNADQRGSDEYNYALGIKRAHYIKEQIIFNTTVLNDNIKIISYGETNTICSENTESCYAKNRRVEIKYK